jgi:hypothetical protein
VKSPKWRTNIRGWRFAQFSVSIELEELKDLLSCPETTSMGEMKEVQDEIIVREKWAEAANQIKNEWFTQYPCVSKLFTGMAHKIALLRMTEFCNCTPDFVTCITEGILQQHEAGAQVVTLCTEARHFTQWSEWEDRPRNQFCLVMAILNHYTQRPAWVYRSLFFPGLKSSGTASGDRAVFKWVSDREGLATTR